ncbi:hypothetical protein [uncultured Reyranella sp.]|uniref:hypothetical protein n=1 Tax=uncultured Reyranella sp. TaxID=735512 RepID=UPI0025F9ACA5|nr:hypothetical protein [uncultured Reyranella sp.]
MQSFRLSVALATAAATLSLAFGAAAQTQPAAPAASSVQGLPKVVGAARHPRLIPSMFVLNARGAKLQDNKLILDGIAPSVIVFADRPVRSAGHAMLAHVLEEWTLKAPNSFAKDPPNATVSVLNKAKASVVDAVVTLKSPKLEGDKLTFEVDVLEGDLAGADGGASVFMDLINLPVPRHSSHRAAWYAGSDSAR